MKNSYDPFYRHMKKILSVLPSSTVDKKILAMASQKLKSTSEFPMLSQWLKLGLTMAFGIALVIAVNIKYNSYNETSKLVISDPLEMVLNYKNIELMADAGTLSEEDWKKIGRER